MKRILIGMILFAMVLVYFAKYLVKPTQPVQAQVIINTTEYQSPTLALPTDTPLPTLTPLPTVDYRATDQAYQLAMEAERNQMIQVQLAHDEEMMKQQVELARINATGTAALTAVVGTGTQQAKLNGFVENNQQLLSGQLTATKEAPTQMAAMLNLREAEKYAKIDRVVWFGFMVIAGVFLLSMSVFLLRWKPPVKVETLEDVQPIPALETIVMLKHDRGGGDFGLKRAVIPCNSEQLTELAQKITSGKKTLAINNWEGADTLFTRTVILQVRSWMKMNGFAVATGDNQLVPTEQGFDFLNGWLESQNLPDEFEFGEEPEEELT